MATPKRPGTPPPDAPLRDPAYEVEDRGDLRKYFSQIPNMIDDMGLTVYAYRLYGHLKRVAGSSGRVEQGTRGLAESCNMSLGSVSKAKEELVNRGLIRIDPSPRVNPEGGRPLDLITILDIWPENFARYRNSPPPSGRVVCSPHEQVCSPHEISCSPHEQKKIEDNNYLKDDMRSGENAAAARSNPPATSESQRPRRSKTRAKQDVSTAAGAAADGPDLRTDAEIAAEAAAAREAAERAAAEKADADRLAAELRDVKAEIRDAYAEVYGLVPLQATKEPKTYNGAVKWLAENGFTGEHVKRCYRFIKTEDYWKARDVTIDRVASRLPDFLAACHEPLPTPRKAARSAPKSAPAPTPAPPSAYSQDFTGSER